LSWSEVWVHFHDEDGIMHAYTFNPDDELERFEVEPECAVFIRRLAQARNEAEKSQAKRDMFKDGRFNLRLNPATKRMPDAAGLQTIANRLREKQET